MIAIKNGKILTPDQIIEGKILLLKQDRIFGFSDSLESVNYDIERVVNAHGRYIMPGLIDVHSDRIEQYISPRPTSQMDLNSDSKYVSGIYSAQVLPPYIIPYRYSEMSFSEALRCGLKKTCKNSPI